MSGARIYTFLSAQKHRLQSKSQQTKEVTHSHTCRFLETCYVQPPGAESGCLGSPTPPPSAKWAQIPSPRPLRAEACPALGTKHGFHMQLTEHGLQCRTYDHIQGTRQIVRFPGTVKRILLIWYTFKCKTLGQAQKQSQIWTSISKLQLGLYSAEFN